MVRLQVGAVVGGGAGDGSGDGEGNGDGRGDGVGRGSTWHKAVGPQIGGGSDAVLELVVGDDCVTDDGVVVVVVLVAGTGLGWALTPLWFSWANVTL